MTLFVPDNVGVKGYEKADRLASIATVACNRVIDQADILNADRDTGRTDFSNSTYLVELLELGVIQNDARNVGYVGS